MSKRQVVRIFVLCVVLVGLGLANIGGCGSSGGGNNPQPTPTPAPPTDPPPTMPPPTDPPPTMPPPTMPPPTDPPPQACVLPGLNTDFSDTLYAFLDTELGILIGVTSDGETVLVGLTDASETVIFLVAEPLGAFACSVFGAIIDNIGFGASGLCGKSDDSTLFIVLDAIVAGVPLPEIILGACVDVVPIDVSVAGAEQGLRGFQSGITQRGEIVQGAELEELVNRIFEGDGDASGEIDIEAGLQEMQELFEAHREGR